MPKENVVDGVQNAPHRSLFHALGLTEEEREGYQRYNNDEEDLEDAIPALNAFEREFLITGMCAECQCDVFRKELPEDVSRWVLETE